MDYKILEKTYWSQFRVVRFQQQLSDDSGDSLALPKIFVENVKDKLGATAKLKTKNGSEWVVKLETCRNGDVFLTNGLKEFVKAHCLKKDDTVMFKHSGNFEFKVTMFDGKTGCENVFGHFVKNIELHPHVVELETQNDVEESSLRCKLECIESSNKDYETVLPPEEEPLRADSLKNNHCPRNSPRAEGTTSCSEKRQTVRRNTLWNKERCLRRAQALETVKSGDCMVYMCASYVKRPYVWSLSCKWVKKHELDGLRAVELHIDGMTWPVKVFVREARGQAGIILGRHFVEDNGFQEGDVCIFTVNPCSTDPVTINVRIVRGVKTADDVLKASSDRNGNSSVWNFPENQNDRNESSRICKLEHIESFDKDYETVLPHEEQPQSADSLNSSQCPIKRPRSEGTTSCSKKKQIVRRSVIQRKKEQCLRRARALEITKSDDCLVYLTACSVKPPCTLYLPVKWLKKHELYGLREEELHIDGKSWPVKFRLRPTGQGGIYSGWRYFVQDNGLQEGDVCCLSVPPGSTGPVIVNVRIIQGVETADDFVKACSDGNGNNIGCYFPEPENFEDSVPSYDWF